MGSHHSLDIFYTEQCSSDLPLNLRFLVFCLVLFGGSCCFVLRYSLLVSKTELEFMILLPSPPNCWDCSNHAWPELSFVSLEKFLKNNFVKSSTVVHTCN